MTRTKSQKARRRQAIASRRAALTTTVSPNLPPRPPPLPPRNPPPRVQRSRVRKPRGRGFYLRSLLDPPSTPGIKCPDLNTMVNTGTAQIVYRTPIGAVQKGTSGTYTAGFLVSPQISCYQAGVASCNTTGTVTWNTFLSAVGWTAFIGLYDRFRVVSASVDVEYTGSHYNDKGTVVGFSTFDGTTLTRYVDGVLEPSSFQCSANKSLRVVFRPIDNQDFEFISVNNSTSSQRFGVLYDNVDQNFSANVTYTVNLEGIPISTSSNLVQLGSANTDIRQLTEATNYLSNMTAYAWPLVAGALSMGMTGRTGGANLMNQIRRRGRMVLPY